MEKFESSLREIWIWIITICIVENFRNKRGDCKFIYRFSVAAIIQVKYFIIWEKFIIYMIWWYDTIPLQFCQVHNGIWYQLLETLPVNIQNNTMDSRQELFKTIIIQKVKLVVLNENCVSIYRIYLLHLDWFKLVLLYSKLFIVVYRKLFKLVPQSVQAWQVARSMSRLDAKDKDNMILYRELE